MSKEIYFHSVYKKWWPKFDHNPKGNYKTIMAGIGAIEVLARECDDYSICVQAGGHLGYWPNELAEYFTTIYTFEADPIVYQCLEKNISRAVVLAHQCALGDSNKIVNLQRGISAGGSRVDPAGNLIVNQITIDSLALPFCDAIALDIEGGEIAALKGAKDTIEEFSPVILVEELPQHRENLIEYMQGLKYKQVAAYGRDRIWKRI